MNEYQEKAEYLVRLMGKELANRYVDSHIAQWLDDELILGRSKSKEYWENVKLYL